MPSTRPRHPFALALALVAGLFVGPSVRADDEPPAPPPLKVVMVRVLDADAKPVTDWLLLSGLKTELYASMMGGRVVRGQVTKEDETGTTFEISGHKLAFQSQTLKIGPKDAGPVTILLTKYPGDRNLSLMYKFTEK